MAKKRLLTSIYTAKSLRKSVLKSVISREQQRVQREQAAQEKLKNGLAGQRFGRHIVPEGEVDVQLGEDLSENFRGLKVRTLNQIALDCVVDVMALSA